MSMTRRDRGWSLALALCVLWAASDALAVDQGITGKGLLLKSTPKLVLLSKDPSITIVGSNPVVGADSTITFDDGNNTATFNLPASGWRANGSGTLFKYKNSSAPFGPSAVKIAKIKPGLLKVVAKGLPFPVPVGPATINVVLTLDGGTNTYCMTFAGFGDGSKFLVKDSTAGTCPTGANPVCCALGSVCGGSTEFYCTVFGGTPVGGGAVCDVSGSCVAAPGTPGGCCEIGDVCQAPMTATECTNGGGIHHPNAVCSPDGTCGDAVCGNNVAEGIEECDGSDDDVCPTLCLGNCTCDLGQQACCEYEGSCGGSVAGYCTTLGGTPVGGGAECDGSGQCVPAAIVQGGCCELSSPLQQCSMPIDQLSCLNAGGSFHANALSCSPSGLCEIAPCQATTGGYCWFLANNGGDNCDTVCANAGRSYDFATATYVGSDGSSSNCSAVVTDLGIPPCGFVTTESANGVGCTYSPFGFDFGACYRDSTSTTAAATPASDRYRVCGCGS